MIMMTVERDTGSAAGEENMLNHLNQLLSGDDFDDSDFDSDDDDDCGLSLLAYMM